MDKIKLATAWLGGCSGCHMSFLDLDERLIELSDKVDIVFSPIVDIKEFPEGVDATLVEGAVANADNLELLMKIRKRSKVVIAFGDCAVSGNVTAMRNGITRDELLKSVYGDKGSELGLNTESHLPLLLDHVNPIHKVVAIDYFLPGCPPHADLIWYVITELLEGHEPILTEDLLKYG
jgi:NAD-reducing hydrogenase small subunit